MTTTQVVPLPVASTDESPALRTITAKIEEAAAAWVEQREDPTAVVEVAEELPDGTVVSWRVDDVIAHEMTFGKRGTEAQTDVGRAALEGFCHSAGRRLAELCLRDTGLRAQDVAEAMERGPSLGAGAAPPDALAGALKWLVARFGGAQPAVRVQRGRIGYYWFLAFATIARSEADARADEADRRAQHSRPVLRQGFSSVRMMIQTQSHVEQARRKSQQLNLPLSPQELEGRRKFVYQPLGWAERLVIHALATIAREQGMLDSHSWATAAKPVKGMEAPRVRLRYPGHSEIARILGHKPDQDGKIPRATRETIERALDDLTRKPRWIAMPVLVPIFSGKRRQGDRPDRWVEDVEVTQTLWAELSETMGVVDEQSRGVWLNLHPVAIASHVRSFMDVPDLGRRYEEARKTLKARQMRDEWAIADDYLRVLAVGVAAGRRREAISLIGSEARPIAVGDLRLTKRVRLDRLLQVLGLAAYAKKQGLPAGLKRVEDAWAFCREMGSLISATYDAKERMFVLTLPDPEVRESDETQLLLMEPEDADVEDPREDEAG